MAWCLFNFFHLFSFWTRRDVEQKGEAINRSTVYRSASRACRFSLEQAKDFTSYFQAEKFFLNSSNAWSSSFIFMKISKRLLSKCLCNSVYNQRMEFETLNNIFLMGNNGRVLCAMKKCMDSKIPVLNNYWIVRQLGYLCMKHWVLSNTFHCENAQTAQLLCCKASAKKQALADVLKRKMFP